MVAARAVSNESATAGGHSVRFWARLRPFRTLDGDSSANEFDTDHGLVAHHPCVVPGRHRAHVTGSDVELRPVLHFHPVPTRNHVLKMRSFAPLRLDDRFDVF